MVPIEETWAERQYIYLCVLVGFNIICFFVGLVSTIYWAHDPTLGISRGPCLQYMHSFMYHFYFWTTRMITVCYPCLFIVVFILTIILF